MVIVGIVGKPNVGKSTFFKALTLSEVEIADYPFTTIKPNVGIGYVKVECIEKYFKVKCNPRTGYCLRKFRFVPIKILDVAGLVPGAHMGRGLGNKFLDDLRQADILIHIIDASGSTDEEGRKVEAGSYDPSKDILWLEDEIDYWFFSIIKRNLEKIKRKINIEKDRAIDILLEILSGLKITKEDIIFSLKKLGIEAYEISSVDNNTLLEFARILRRKSKPILIAANKIDTSIAKEIYKNLKKKFEDRVIIPVSAYSELILKEFSRRGYIDYIPGEKDFTIKNVKDEKIIRILEFIKENVLNEFGSTGVQDIIDFAVLNFLNYIPVWPVANEKLTDSEGRVLPDCYLVKKGTKVIELAEKIHSDLAKNFIKAKELRSGKIVGKDYELEYNDVIMIITK